MDKLVICCLPDRHDAKRTAMKLVKDGIAALAREKTPDRTISIDGSASQLERAAGDI